MRKFSPSPRASSPSSRSSRRRNRQPQPAQTPEPIQGPSFRTGIDLVAVDVSVVDQERTTGRRSARAGLRGEDRRGSAARGLRRSGQGRCRGRAKATGRQDDRVSIRSNLTPPNGRRIVLAIDQVHIGTGSLRPVLDAASRFLDRLSPLDQVALVAYPEPGVRVDFTNDKVRLRRALQRLVGHAAAVHDETSQHRRVRGDGDPERRDEHALHRCRRRECPRLEQTSATTIGVSRRSTRNPWRWSGRHATTPKTRSAGCVQLLEQLAKVEGPKLMILLSEGFLADDLELRSLATLAGEARTSINVLVVDLRQTDVTDAILGSRTRPRIDDSTCRVSKGSRRCRAEASSASRAQASRSLSGWRPRSPPTTSLAWSNDRVTASADRHRIDVEVRRRDVTIRSRQAFVLSPARLAARAREAPEAALRETLASPFAVSGLPLRATTFAQQDPESDKVRLVVAAQVGEAGAEPGAYPVGFIVVNNENQVAASFLERDDAVARVGQPQ